MFGRPNQHPPQITLNNNGKHIMITYILEMSGQYKPQLLNLKLKKSSHAKMESVITHESTYSAAVSWLGSQNNIFCG